MNDADIVNEADDLYSNHDASVLSGLIQRLEPQSILDLGPRKGKTTKTIINAVLENNTNNVEYHIFEKDTPFLDHIKDYCLNLKQDKISFTFNKNAVGFDFSKIPKLDLCFIDANHDYILSRWYIDTLFPLVKQSGVIHIHDIYYSKNGKGWDDVGFRSKPWIYHADIISQDIHKELYPSIFDKYKEDYPIAICEEDVIKNYCLNHADSIKTFSTCHPPTPTLGPFDDDGNDKVANCALYIYNKEYEYFNIGA